MFKTTFFCIVLACFLAISHAQDFDLAINEAGLAPTFDWVNVDPQDCNLAEGCYTGSGMRRLLRFTTQVVNLGPDLPIGNPQNNAAFFTFNQCRQSWQRNDLNFQVLLDQQGNPVAQSTKQGFCLEDMADVNGTTPGAFDCNNQGLSSGWMDVYSADLDCQFIDITTVPPGAYWLRVEVNANGAIPETNHDNNVGWALVAVDPDQGPVPSTTPSPSATPVPTPTPTTAPNPTPTPTTSPQNPTPVDPGVRDTTSAASRLRSILSFF